MWNRPALVLWFSVRVRREGRRGFRLGIPVPIFLLYQWTDMLSDALLFLRLFPRVRRAEERFHAGPVLKALDAFARELRRLGPQDLMEIEAESGGRTVEVRCLLR